MRTQVCTHFFKCVIVNMKGACTCVLCGAGTLHMTSTSHAQQQADIGIAVVFDMHRSMLVFPLLAARLHHARPRAASSRGGRGQGALQLMLWTATSTRNVCVPIQLGGCNHVRNTTWW
jgi:hypothetical protein